MTQVPDAAAPALALRPAGPDDCARVWAWNFAPEVRAASRDPRAVDLDEHARWYTRRLAAAGDPMWIVVAGDDDVGVVRLDRCGDEHARISIALDASARGRGLGRRAIAAVCAEVRRPIVAEVVAGNRASRAAFEACGFRLASEHDALVTLTWRP